MEAVKRGDNKLYYSKANTKQIKILYNNPTIIWILK